MKFHETREQWLLATVHLINPIFVAKKHVVPNDCQVSCDFASTSTKKHHIGQRWYRCSSTHERNQIFISRALGDPMEVLDTLVHELVHTVDNCEHKHDKKFTPSIGLEGTLRSAGTGRILKVVLTDHAQQLGLTRTGSSKWRISAKYQAQDKKCYARTEVLKCPY